MLDNSEVMAWYARHGSSERAQSVINHIRSAAPARRVGGGKRNVAGRYPSRKMGVAIQFESHRVELAVIYELEQDPDVLEYYDQPPAIKLEYQSASGRNLGVLHTADFFVLRKNGAGWEECKTQDELVHLSRQNENRYRSDDGTNWRCPPGESYAASDGLYYRVRSSRDIDWVFQRNVQFMEDYFRGEREVPAAVRDVITAHVNASPGLSLDQLLCSTAHTASADDIFSLIAAGGLYADFRKVPFTEPLKVAVFVDHRSPAPAALESGARVIATTTAIETRLAKASENDLRIANLRLRYVSGALHGEAVQDPEPPAGRTLRRWIAAYRKAESAMGSGYIGLLPEARHGNSTAKLPEASRTLMEEFITADYETLKQKTVYASWLALKLVAIRRESSCPAIRPIVSRFAAAPFWSRH